MINNLQKIINKIIDKSYKKNQKMSITMRYKKMSEGFEEIMLFMDKHYQNESKEYYTKRSKQDKKLTSIQKTAFNEIKKCIDVSLCNKNIKYELIPASSFSAKTNLINESDIDFAILVHNINEDKAICFSNALGNCKYILTDIRNPQNIKRKHWVFQKYINKVEIEGKVRDYKGFYEMLKMHQYTDNKMSKKEKILTTYTKYLLKKYAKKEYEKFKMIYYCNAGYHGKSKELLYPLL
jgi:hypothetical protein